MKRILLIAALALVTSGCHFARHTTVSGIQSFGVTYARERTNDTCLFVIGYLHAGAAQRLVNTNDAVPLIILPRRSYDPNPLNVQPKVP